MDGIWESSFRTLLGFGLLLVLTRFIGKKQLGQMNVFTYITGIAIGNMAGDMIIHRDVKLTDAIVGLVLWTFLAIIVEYASMKNVNVRTLLNGEPSIIIKKGLIDEQQLKRHRLNMDDLTMLLRTNNVFSLLDVDYAILEPNGDLSVLKKAMKDSVTKEDINLVTIPMPFIPSEIIVDGKIVSKNLKELGKTQEWLFEELRKENIYEISNVLYAELQNDNYLYIQQRNIKVFNQSNI